MSYDERQKADAALAIKTVLVFFILTMLFYVTWIDAQRRALVTKQGIRIINVELQRIHVENDLRWPMPDHPAGAHWDECELYFTVALPPDPGVRPDITTWSDHVEVDVAMCDKVGAR